MKPSYIVRELIRVAEGLGFRVRYDTGNFRGGSCTLREEQLILLNRRHPVEAHVAVLAEALRGQPVEGMFLRPAVRSALEEVWTASPLEETLSDEE